MDGTPRRRVFARITVPLLSPMLAYVVITGFIGGFKEYTSIVGIFGEAMGPARRRQARLNTMVGFIYDALSNQQSGPRQRRRADPFRHNTGGDPNQPVGSARSACIIEVGCG